MGSDVRPVSGPELKVALTGLGLPLTWLAKRTGVVIRTAVRWCDAEAIPPRAAVELEKITDETLAEMRRMVATNPTVVSTYRTDGDIGNGLPASWHRALTFRVVDHLRTRGNDVTVQYH